jgi:hypothetical protein
MSDAQRITSTLLTEAAMPPVKRTAREIAEERWFGTKEKPPPSPSASCLSRLHCNINRYPQLRWVNMHFYII